MAIFDEILSRFLIKLLSPSFFRRVIAGMSNMFETSEISRRQNRRYFCAFSLQSQTRHENCNGSTTKIALKIPCENGPLV